MYGWDLCPCTGTVAEKAYKEPWKLANGHRNDELSQTDFMETTNARKRKSDSGETIHKNWNMEYTLMSEKKKKMGPTCIKNVCWEIS